MPKPWEVDWDSSQPTITELPPSAQQQRENALRERGDARDETRTDIAVRSEPREVQKQGFQLESDLRKEFNSLPQVKEYQTVIRQYATALKTPANASGDQALITAYAKMLDPGSVVREQEFSTVANADSAIGRATAELQKQFGISGGGMLRPEIRQKIRDNMQNLTEGYNQAYTQERQRYGQVAQENGIKADNVVGPHLGQPFYEQIEKYRTPQPKQSKTIGQLQREDRRAPPIPFGGNEEGLTGTVSDDGYQDSYLGQGMSGVNEGIANVLGGPVDLATAAINLPIRGFNAIANTGIPTIDEPFLGSGYIKDAMGGWGVYDDANDPSKQFVRRTGESVGAALFPAGAAGSVPRAAAATIGGLGGGVGAATAQQAFPGNPLAEFIGEMAGGGVAGAGLMGAARAQGRREIEKAVPTIGDLKAQAGELYRRAETRGVTADPALTQKLADDFRMQLAQEGRISPTGRLSEVYPKAKEAMQLVDDYSGSTMSPTQMQTVRGVIAEGLNSPENAERRMASMLTDTFDEWANPLAPELPQARDIASRYLNAQKLEQARELAAARAGQFTGSGFENALRTEYRGLDRGAIKGQGRYNEDLTQAIENVSRGTPASNFARNMGRFAPRGPVSLMGGVGAPATIGGMIGGPAGAAIGAGGAVTIGELGRKAATNMGIRNADMAELIARNGGALPEPKLNLPEIQKLAAQLAAALQAGYLSPEDINGGR